MRVIENINLGDKQLLALDGEKPGHYTHVRLNGQVFRPIPAFGMPRCVAIQDTKPHLGEDVEFVWLPSEVA